MKSRRNFCDRPTAGSGRSRRSLDPTAACGSSTCIVSSSKIPGGFPNANWRRWMCEPEVRSAGSIASETPPTGRPRPFDFPQQIVRFVPRQKTSACHPSIRELEIQQIALANRTDERRRIRTASPTYQRPMIGCQIQPGEMIHYRTIVDAAGRLPVTDDVVAATRDPHPGIRRYGLVMAEKYFRKNPLPDSVIAATTDEDSHVRLQAAFSLGNWDVVESGSVLVQKWP